MSNKNKKIGIILTISGLLLISILIAYLILSFQNNQIQPTEKAPQDKEFVSEEIVEEFISEKEKDLKPPEPVITFENFEQIIDQLDTSEKLVAYLNGNFTFEPKEGVIALEPKDFFEKKKGGEQDFAAFSAYTLYQNNFISFVFAYQYIDNIDKNNKEKTRFLTSFRDKDAPKYIYFNEKGAHLVVYGWSYEELCQKEEERLGVKILRYGTISPLATELVRKEWVQRD